MAEPRALDRAEIKKKTWLDRDTLTISGKLLVVGGKKRGMIRSRDFEAKRQKGWKGGTVWFEGSTLALWPLDRFELGDLDLGPAGCEGSIYMR